jgi:hypothetical protein
MGSNLGGTSFYCRLDGQGHLVGLNPMAFNRSGINAFWGIFEGELSLAVILRLICVNQVG